ncbi:hypothetical protein HZ326_5369 [Fusarium oxysporum f. sp. albedinis]|nr:hypothetical protein HZ326_5369 [Fusarium oxysporum f. sp. albedinis]
MRLFSLLLGINDASVSALFNEEHRKRPLLRELSFGTSTVAPPLGAHNQGLGRGLTPFSLKSIAVTLQSIEKSSRVVCCFICESISVA